MAVNSFIFENMVCQFPIGEWPSPKDLTIFHFVELIAKENCMGRSVKSFNNIITRIKNMTRPKNNDSVVNMIYKESLRALLVDIKTRKIRGYLEGSNESDKTKKSEPVNRLTGEGERSSQVTDRLVLKGRFDVSSLLMEAREELVKLEEQRQGTLLSSPDILSINFIFTKEFMEKYCPKDRHGMILSHFFKATTTVALSEQDLAFSKFCMEKAEASNSASEYRACLEQGWEGASEMLKSIFTTVGSDTFFWEPPKINEMTYSMLYLRPYLYAIAETIGLCDYEFPTEEYYEERFRPDHLVTANGLPLLIVEVKLPGTSNVFLRRDFRKLLSEMKLALDLLFAEGVVDPTVLGLLVQKDQMEIFVMTLDCEAIYIPRLLGKVTLPKDKKSLGVIAEAVPILEATKAPYLKAKEAVEGRPASVTGAVKHAHTWVRPSFHLCKLKDRKRKRSE